MVFSRLHHPRVKRPPAAITAAIDHPAVADATK